jgi:hypothetical protein
VAAPEARGRGLARAGNAAEEERLSALGHAAGVDFHAAVAGEVVLEEQLVEGIVEGEGRARSQEELALPPPASMRRAESGARPRTGSRIT